MLANSYTLTQLAIIGIVIISFLPKFVIINPYIYYHHYKPRGEFQRTQLHVEISTMQPPNEK